MLNILMLVRLEKTIFFEETAKNCSRGAFDHSLGKGGVLHKKLI